MRTIECQKRGKKVSHLLCPKCGHKVSIEKAKQRIGPSHRRATGDTCSLDILPLNPDLSSGMSKTKNKIFQ